MDTPTISDNVFLSVAEASRLMNYSTKTLRGLLSKNQIDYYRIGRKILIKRIDLYEYIEQFKVKSIKTL